MKNNFIIEALPDTEFKQYTQLNNEQLKPLNAKWLIADANPGYPCRVSLVDAQIGERVLVLPYIHHNVNSAYQGSGPIFVREQAIKKNLVINEIPAFLHHRQLSVRAYNCENNMIAARITSGAELTKILDQLLDDAAIEYIHIHNAGPGCFNCAVYRAKENVQSS